MPRRCVRSTGSISPWRKAPCWACWGPTALVRRPPSGSSPRCSGRTAAGPPCSATTCCARPSGCGSEIGLSGQYAAVDENLTGAENLWMFGRLYQLPSATAKARAGELLEQFGLSRGRGPGGEDLLRRHAAAARPGLRADRPAAAAVPRRADHRARPAQPDRHVGGHPRAGADGGDAAAHHPIPGGGGRAGRPDRGRRRRPDHRPGHRRRAEVPGRRRAGGGGGAQGRTTSRRPATCWPGPAWPTSRSTSTRRG